MIIKKKAEEENCVREWERWNINFRVKVWGGMGIETFSLMGLVFLCWNAYATRVYIVYHLSLSLTYSTFSSYRSLGLYLYPGYIYLLAEHNVTIITPLEVEWNLDSTIRCLFLNFVVHGKDLLTVQQNNNKKQHTHKILTTNKKEFNITSYYYNDKVSFFFFHEKFSALLPWITNNFKQSDATN